MLATGDGAEVKGDASPGVALQPKLEALRRRVEELERENSMLLSRISGCSRCSKNIEKMCADDRSGIAGEPSGGSSSEIAVYMAGGGRDSAVDVVEPGDGVGSKAAKSKKGCQQQTIQQHRQRFVALKIMYFGQRFYGFASEAHSDPTIESEIFKALAKTKLAVGSKESIHYSRCGRTDKGVSSVGQVIALYLRSAVASSKVNGETQGEIDYVKMLNRVLPRDIRVMGWCPVPTTFHSRFSCLSREYKYFFWRGEMDIEAMQNAGRKFIGEHDFRNFCKMDALNVSNYRRRIGTFEICPCDERYGHDELYAFIIRGSAFLWHQVRCMVALLFMIGQGLESPTIIDMLLDTSKFPRKPQYNMASEQPLMLRCCEFEGLRFPCSEDAKQALVDDFTSTIQSYLLKAAIFREALGCISISGETVIDHTKKKRAHIPLLRRPTERMFDICKLLPNLSHPMRSGEPNWISRTKKLTKWHFIGFCLMEYLSKKLLLLQR